MSGVVEALTFITRSFPRKERAYLRVRWHGQLCDAEALTLNILRGVVMGWAVLFSYLEDKAGKSRDLTGACFPIMLLITVGLGGSMAVAYNALALIPVIGDWERFCARGLSICSTLFP